jgi:hypothetical protein
MVFIWTNRCSQGYSSVQNTATAINDDICSFLEMKMEDIIAIRDIQKYEKFLVGYF